MTALGGSGFRESKGFGGRAALPYGLRSPGGGALSYDSRWFKPTVNERLVGKLETTLLPHQVDDFNRVAIVLIEGMKGEAD